MQNETTAERAIEIWRKASTRDSQRSRASKVEALKEMRQRLADMPAAKLRRLPESQMLKELLEVYRAKREYLYENAVGIDLYNVYVQMFLEEPLSEKNRDKLAETLVDFFVYYSSGSNILLHVGMGNILNLEKMTEEEKRALGKQANDKHMSIANAQIVSFIKRMLNGELVEEYAQLFKKALSAKPPTEADLWSMSHWIRENSWLMYDESNGMIMEVTSMGIQAILSGAYRFLQRLWNGEVSAGICTAPKCQRAFLVTPGGKPQLYCGQACRMRAYRYRKRESSEVAV